MLLLVLIIRASKEYNGNEKKNICNGYIDFEGLNGMCRVFAYGDRSYHV